MCAHKSMARWKWHGSGEVCGEGVWLSGKCKHHTFKIGRVLLVPYPLCDGEVERWACDMGCHPNQRHNSCAPGCCQAPQLDPRAPRSDHWCLWPQCVLWSNDGLKASPASNENAQPTFLSFMTFCPCWFFMLQGA